MFSFFNFKKIQKTTHGHATFFSPDSALDNVQRTHPLITAPITKVDSFLGAYIYGFLSSKEALKSRLTCKQLSSWDRDDRNNRTWDEHLKTDFGCHENFVMHLPNSKQVYKRLRHLKNDIPEEIQYFVLQAESGYKKDMLLKGKIREEKKEAYFYSALAVGDLKLASATFDKNFINRKAYTAACLGGHEPILRWITTQLNFVDSRERFWFLATAILTGDIQLVSSLINVHKLQFDIDQDHVNHLLSLATESGNLKLVKWLMTEAPWPIKPKPTLLTLYHTAKSGNLEMMRWLLLETPIKSQRNYLTSVRDLFCELRTSRMGLTVPGFWNHIREYQWRNSWRYALAIASRSGNFKLFYFLYKNLPSDVKLNQSDYSNIADASAGSGNEALTVWWSLKMPKEHLRYCSNNYVLNKAIISQNIHLVKRLINPGDIWKIKPTIESLNSAASTGNIALMQLILDAPNFDSQPDYTTLFHAAFSKKFAVIEWLASPERGQHQLHITEKMINDAIGKYSFARCSSGTVVDESILLSKKTLELLDKAHTLIEKPSFELRY